MRFEALAAEERKTQGWIDLALGAVTIAVGVAAIVASGGAATPLVAGAWIAGSGTVAYGLSNTVEAGHNLYLGYQGDGKTHATNPIRDTLFMGNDRTYHQVGGLFTTASAVLIPIGKTQSLAKGLTEFTIGEVGGFAGHQAAYHGTKLLGGSEEDAQRASLVGSILGGYAASSAASKFTLNDIAPSKAKVPEVDRPSYNREQILKNIEESKLARESSNFQTYLKNENATKNFLKTLEDMSPDEARRYQQWHKYVEAGISPADRVRVLEISENAPKVEYQPVYSSDDILAIPRSKRPDVENVYSPDYIKLHRRQFDNGATKFQKFKPSESWNGGIVGGDDGISFWLSKNDADIIEDVAKGDFRIYETLLGFDKGYFGEGPLYRLDVAPEVIARKGISIPNGREHGVNNWWRPGGRTYPGNMPEGVMEGISTKEGDYIWNILN